MSTTSLKDRYAPLDTAWIGHGTDGVYVGVDKTILAHRADVIVDRAEFLAAVATELDVIVIDKTTLPETHVGDGKVDFIYGEQGHIEPIPQGIDADELIALGLALKATPPVDEAQVDALAQHLYAATNDPNDIDVPDVARRLVAAGVRAPQAGDPK